MEFKTLKDLKDFLGTLNETQLSQRPYLIRLDEMGHEIRGCDISDEDEVIDDEGTVPISQFVLPEGETMDDYEILPAGYVRLYDESFYDDEIPNVD